MNIYLKKSLKMLKG